MNSYYVYILSNYTRTTFYVGVTGNLSRRIGQHAIGLGSEFTAKYNLKYLVYYEEFSSAREAICREKQLKAWHRDWKLRLIRNMNPEFRDLTYELAVR